MVSLLGENRFPWRSVSCRDISQLLQAGAEFQSVLSSLRWIGEIGFVPKPCYFTNTWRRLLKMESQNIFTAFHHPLVWLVECCKLQAHVRSRDHRFTKKRTHTTKTHNEHTHTHGVCVCGTMERERVCTTPINKGLYNDDSRTCSVLREGP